MKAFRWPLLAIVLAGFFLSGCASEELTSAKLYIQQEDWKNAEEFLLKALKVEPDNPEVPFLLAREIYARQKNWKKVAEMLDRAMEHPDQKILQGSTVGKYVELARLQYWTDLYNEGVRYFNAYRNTTGDERIDNLKKAIASFETAKLINPQEGQTYTILATSYFELGEKDTALEVIKKAVELKPDDQTTNMTAGQILTKMGKLEEAQKYFQKVVKLDPGNTDAIRYLAQNYYDLNQMKKAIEVYEIGIRKENDLKKRGDLYFNLGVLYMKIKEYANAEDNFMMAYELNPDDKEALLGIAQTFESVEKWRRAEKFYKELIYIDPDNPEYYRAMARVLLHQGKADEAQRYFEKSKRVGK